MNETPTRRWYHFSIRELFLVTMIVGLSLALYSERVKSYRLNFKLTTMRHYARLKGWDIVVMTSQGGWSFVMLPPHTGRETPEWPKP